MLRAEQLLEFAEKAKTDVLKLKEDEHQLTANGS